MKCNDNELIQKYIDGETTLSESKQVEKHIADCRSCIQNIEEQKTFTDYIKKEIGRWGKQPLVIPEFLAPIPKKNKLKLKIKHYYYAVSAACVIFLLLFLFPEQKSKEKETRLIYGFCGDFDSNLPVSQQEMTIIIIDSNGKVIESN